MAIVNAMFALAFIYIYVYCIDKETFNGIPMFAEQMISFSLTLKAFLNLDPTDISKALSL